jgi:hypothetical protein
MRYTVTWAHLIFWTTAHEDTGTWFLGSDESMIHDDVCLLKLLIFVDIDCKILLALILVCGDMMLMLMDTCFICSEIVSFLMFIEIKHKSIPLDRMTQT